MFYNLLLINLFLTMQLMAVEIAPPHITWITPAKVVSVFFTIPVAHNDALYKEYMTFTVDNSNATIVNWSTDQEPTFLYDKQFKENKKAYTTNTTFTITIELKKAIKEAYVRVTYYLKSIGHIKEELFLIPLVPTTAHVHVDTTVSASISETTTDIHQDETASANEITTPSATASEVLTDVSWSCSISNLIEQTHSLWLQSLLIFLLGLLLSFTPCIYPMIPITIGILQKQGSTSLLRNFFVSCFYTLGVATTFALFGLTAAYTGKLFGSFLHHPAVIVIIVTLLLYLAGSMFGLYEMYVPRMFNNNHNVGKGGPILTAFLFGAMSGTIASPCVSPGLALVLSIVADMANPFIGFLFLFVFGVGLSMPLLIIGTFSGSLQLLPKAGMWMVEVKTLFGFLLLGTSLSFLRMIIPSVVAEALLTLLLSVMGIYYLYKGKKGSLFKRTMYNLFGMILIIIAVISAYTTVRTSFAQEHCAHSGIWNKEFVCAIAHAKESNKLIFMKVGAPCCSMCTAIDKKFFYHDNVIATLNDHYICVALDGGDEHNKEITDTYGIIGFPTLLIINPHDNTIIQKWMSELYHYSVEQLIEELSAQGTAFATIK